MLNSFIGKTGSVPNQDFEHGCNNENIYRCRKMKHKTFGLVFNPEPANRSPSTCESKIHTPLFDLRLGVLGRRLVDMAQTEGPVSQKYLRTHVKELEEALTKAREFGLKDEFLVNSAATELQNSKSIMEHASIMQGFIDENPLKGCGAGMYEWILAFSLVFVM